MKPTKWSLHLKNVLQLQQLKQKPRKTHFHCSDKYCDSYASAGKEKEREKKEKKDLVRL